MKNEMHPYNPDRAAIVNLECYGMIRKAVKAYELDSKLLGGKINLIVMTRYCLKSMVTVRRQL